MSVSSTDATIDTTTIARHPHPPPSGRTSTLRPSLIRVVYPVVMPEHAMDEEQRDEPRPKPGPVCSPVALDATATPQLLEIPRGVGRASAD